MHSKLDTRLRKLEQAQPGKGWRNFTQDQDDPSIYWETRKAETAQEMTHFGFDPKTYAVGPPFSRDDIRALSDEGWQCMIVEWEHDWRSVADGGQVVRMEW